MENVKDHDLNVRGRRNSLFSSIVTKTLLLGTTVLSTGAMTPGSTSGYTPEISPSLGKRFMTMLQDNSLTPIEPMTSALHSGTDTNSSEKENSPEERSRQAFNNVPVDETIRKVLAKWLMRLPLKGSTISTDVDYDLIDAFLAAMNLDKNWDRIIPAVEKYVDTLSKGACYLSTNEKGQLQPCYNPNHIYAKNLPYSSDFVNMVDEITKDNNPTILWGNGQYYPLRTVLLASQDWFDFAFCEAVRRSSKFKNDINPNKAKEGYNTQTNFEAVLQDNSHIGTIKTTCYALCLLLALAVYFKTKENHSAYASLWGKHKRKFIGLAGLGAEILIYAGNADKLIELADAYYAYYFYDTGLLARPHLMRASLRNVCKRYAMEQGSGSRFYGQQYSRIPFGDKYHYNFYDEFVGKREKENKELIIKALRQVGYDPTKVVVKNGSSNPRYTTNSLTAATAKPIKHWDIWEIVPDKYKSNIQTNRR